MTDNELYEYLGSHSIGLVRDPNYPNRNYGYLDFPNQKIRIIGLNTADAQAENPAVEGSGADSEGISSQQYQWLINTALDFSDKSDAANWGIIICSHHPLNYTTTIKETLQVLEGYKNSGSGTVTYTVNNKTYVAPAYAEDGSVSNGTNEVLAEYTVLESRMETTYNHYATYENHHNMIDAYYEFTLRRC